MAVSKTDLLFYLTSLEPGVSQTDVSASLGGYPSTSEVNPSALLSSNLSFAGATVTVSASGNGQLQIGAELLDVTGSGTTKTIIGRGALGTDELFHSSGSRVFWVSKSNLFNASFNANQQQYRCIAVTNTNATDTFHNLKFYIKSASRSPASVIKFAVEVPSTELLNSTATRGSTISLVDESLIGDFADDYFKDCTVYIKDNSSPNYNFSRVAASFDGSSGTFTFVTAFPSAISAGTAYRVENAPAQTIASGALSPAFGTNRVSSLSTAGTMTSAVGINVSGDRDNGNNLGPKETIYIWFERTAVNGVVSLTDNRVIFTASYTTS